MKKTIFYRALLLSFALCMFTTITYAGGNRDGTIFLRNGQTIIFYKISQPHGFQGYLDGPRLEIGFKFISRLIFIDKTSYECQYDNLGELLVYKDDNSKFNITKAYMCFGNPPRCTCGSNETGRIYYTTFNPITEMTTESFVSIKDVSKIEFSR